MFGLKNCVPILRSSSNSKLPIIRGVKANRMEKAVTSMAQANNGIRLSDMPGARIRKMAMIISMPAAIAATSATPKASSQ